MQEGKNAPQARDSGRIDFAVTVDQDPLQPSLVGAMKILFFTIADVDSITGF